MPLSVTSRRITPAELGITEFQDLLGSASTCFIKDHQGLIGWGEAKRLTAIGPNRISELDQQWKELVKTATINNQADLTGSGLIAFGSIAFSNQSNTESILVIPELIIGKNNDDYFLTTINISENEALKLIQKGNSTPLSFSEGTITAEQFKTNVARAVELIHHDEISKFVLARDLVANTTNYNPNQAIAKLTHKYPSCYSYLVEGMFGASPELLVSVESKTVTARVLAGTAGRGTDVEVDRAIGEALTQSHKNLEEHKYAIDSLTAAMQELCEEIATNEKPFSLPLANLWHLASDVTAKLKSDSSSLQLVSALHPSAAVAGTPRTKALELIEEIEAIDRGRYAGPIGWVSADGDGIWAIALRGAQITESKVTAFAGCGIVKESDPESELAETNLKFKTVLENL